MADNTVKPIRVRKVADLTAATGTASDTINDVTGSFSQTVLNDNFKSLAAKMNDILAALRAINGIQG